MVFEGKSLNARAGGIKTEKQRRVQFFTEQYKRRQCFRQRISLAYSQNNFDSNQAVLQEKSEKVSPGKPASPKLYKRPLVAPRNYFTQQKKSTIAPDEIQTLYQKNQLANRIKKSQDFMYTVQIEDDEKSKKQEIMEQQQQQKSRSQIIHKQQQQQQRSSQTSQLMKRPRKFMPRSIDVEPQALEMKETVRVRFSMHIKVEYGQSLRVVGSSVELGDWQVKKGIDMKWSEGDVWRMEVRLPCDTVVGYKYVVIGSDGNACSWQSGNNSVLVVDAKAGQVLQVVDNWGAQPGAMVRNGQNVSTREKALTQWSEQMNGTVQSQRQEIRRSRMELFEARQELQESTQECARLRAELAAIQKERLEASKLQRQQQKQEELARAEALRVRMEMKQMLEHASEILHSNDQT